MVVANPVGGEHSPMGGDMAEATLLIRGGRTVELGGSPSRRSPPPSWTRRSGWRRWLPRPPAPRVSLFRAPSSEGLSRSAGRDRQPGSTTISSPRTSRPASARATGGCALRAPPGVRLRGRASRGLADRATAPPGAHPRRAAPAAAPSDQPGPMDRSPLPVPAPRGGPGHDPAGAAGQARPRPNDVPLQGLRSRTLPQRPGAMLDWSSPRPRRRCSRRSETQSPGPGRTSSSFSESPVRERPRSTWPRSRRRWLRAEAPSS